MDFRKFKRLGSFFNGSRETIRQRERRRRMKRGASAYIGKEGDRLSPLFCLIRSTKHHAGHDPKTESHRSPRTALKQWPTKLKARHGSKENKPHFAQRPRYSARDEQMTKSDRVALWRSDSYMCRFEPMRLLIYVPSGEGK